MSYLVQANKLKLDYDYQITFENYEKEECFEELLYNARNLRNRIFGIAMMRNIKSKDDEDSVKILDEIIGDRDSQSVQKTSQEANNGN